MNHEQSHQSNNYNRSFAIAVILNVVFVVIEAGYGVFADSLALIADAGHNLSDVVSLLLAWGANLLSKKAATLNRTYGLKKTTIMASMASAIILLVALGGITWEAIGRFFDPQSIEGTTVIVLAGIGVAINSITALLFIKGQKHDLNIRGAFLHMAADAGISLGVVVAGVFVLLRDWLWIDPVASLLIAAVIFAGTWGLLRDSANYAIDAVPKHIDLPEVREYLLSLENVSSIHDLHVWPLSTTEIALTVHLVVDNESLDNNFLRALQQHLHDYFGIEHSTIQIESARGKKNCMLDRQTCE